jgi:hypothetical protein
MLKYTHSHKKTYFNDIIQIVSIIVFSLMIIYNLYLKFINVYKMNNGNLHEKFESISPIIILQSSQRNFAKWTNSHTLWTVRII